MKNAPIIEKKNIIIVFSAVLVVLLGIMGYVTGNQIKRNKISEIDTDINKIKTVSQTDSLQDIENDLNNTEIGNLDKEFDEIDKELESAY